MRIWVLKLHLGSVEVTSYNRSDFEGSPSNCAIKKYQQKSVQKAFSCFLLKSREESMYFLNLRKKKSYGVHLSHAVFLPCLRLLFPMTQFLTFTQCFTIFLLSHVHRHLWGRAWGLITLSQVRKQSQNPHDVFKIGRKPFFLNIQHCTTCLRGSA